MVARNRFFTGFGGSSTAEASGLRRGGCGGPASGGFDDGSGYVQPDDGGSAVDPVDPWTDDGFTPPPAG